MIEIIYRRGKKPQETPEPPKPLNHSSPKPKKTQKTILDPEKGVVKRRKT